MSEHNPFTHVQDAPFWYLLAGEVLRRGEGELAPLFQRLTDRAGERGLPIVYQGRKSLYWAVAGRLYLFYESRVPDLDRSGFRHMIRGLQCAFTPPVFAQAAIGRILANIASPSSPNRSVAETVADTFMANGMSVTDSYDGAESDGWILEACLGDERIMALSLQAVTPPEGLWDRVAAFYAENRPGLYYRLFPGKIKSLPKVGE